MVTYLLKFSACLLVFWLVYVLFLERQTMHRFKRFYLLGAIALALAIPNLTITEYVEPVVTDFEIAPMSIPFSETYIELSQEPTPFIDLTTLLWIIYGLGVISFASRFVINLIKMKRYISKNETISKTPFIYVLLQTYRIPHSFFKYIFLNKSKYENNDIPKEVLLHEETHAKQLHSLDILILEVLQIVFWFNPLIYLFKHHIKLNHEFLADEAVLKQGIETKTYQNILLQFSSRTANHQLASAINYSSIKKRFTVMKTQTSKTRIWVSTLLLLPVIAILYYTFSNTEYLEKENTVIADAIKEELKEAGALEIMYVGDGVVEAYLKKYKAYESLRNEEPHYVKRVKDEQTELENLYKVVIKMWLNLTQEEKKLVNEPIPQALPYSQQIQQKNGVVKYYKPWEIPDNYKDSNSFIIINTIKSFSTKDDNLPTIQQMEQHLIMGKMGYLKHNDAVYHYVVDEDKSLKLFNEKGQWLDRDESIFAEVNTFQKKSKSKGGPNPGDAQEIYNPSFLEYIIEMEKEGATFYLDDKKISAKEAKSIATNNKSKTTEMLTQKDANGKYVVKLSSSIKNTHYARSIDLKILNNGSYLIDGIKATKATFTSVFNQLHLDITPEIRNKIMNIHVTSFKEISNKEVWFIYNSLIDYGFYRIVTPNQEINRAKGNTPFAIESSPSTQQKATAKQVAAYNTWAKKINMAMAKAEASNNKVNEYPIIKQKEVDRYKLIYSIMSAEQKKVSETFPKGPPPPPRPTTKKKNSKGGPNTSNFQHYPIPPPIPENATPIQREKMQRAIDEFEKKYKRKVHTAKMEETGELISLIANDDVYEPEEIQEKATAKQVADYNAWAKQLNASGNKIIKKNDLKNYKYIYSIMTAEQRKASVAFPKIPPPPPPIKANQYKNDNKKTLKEIIKETPNGIESGYELLDNGESHYYTVYKGKKTYYNKDGYITDKKGKVLPPPPPAIDTIYTYNNLAKRTKFIPSNRKNNIKSLKVLFNNMSSLQKTKVENPNSISKYVEQLENLSVKQIKEINAVYNNIKAEALSKGRKFYTSAEYKKLEKLYTSMLSGKK